MIDYPSMLTDWYAETSGEVENTELCCRVLQNGTQHSMI